MAAEINRRAQLIDKERAKKAAAEERAAAKHEARKASIRQELADLNQQLADNPELKHNLSEVLREKNDFQTYKPVDEISLCIGLPISTTSGQIALMTEQGIQVLKVNSRAAYNKASGNHQVQTFTPLRLDNSESNVDGLFPKTKFKVGQLADNIANIVLQSPNRK